MWVGVTLPCLPTKVAQGGLQATEDSPAAVLRQIRRLETKCRDSESLPTPFEVVATFQIASSQPQAPQSLSSRLLTANDAQDMQKNQPAAKVHLQPLSDISLVHFSRRGVDLGCPYFQVCMYA